VGGIPEVIQDGLSGVLGAPGHRGDGGQYLGLLRDPDLRRRMGEPDDESSPTNSMSDEHRANDRLYGISSEATVQVLWHSRVR
jgi:hypothetical protein